MKDFLKYDLHMSDSFRDATDARRAEVCNGAGAKNGIKVPNTFWGLNMRPAFDIHDWDYEHGFTKEDKAMADRYMFFNTLVIIEAQTGLQQIVLKPLRRRRALAYYEIVTIGGERAFWVNKTIPTTVEETLK